MDFLCRMKIKEEKEEIHLNEVYNELLLANILPKHVAEHFTVGTRSKSVSVSYLNNASFEDTCYECLI